MKTIHKYTLDITGRFEVEMPVFAEILSIQMQAGKPQLWAMINPYEPRKETRIFAAYLSGKRVEGNWLATVQLNERVFHFFEITDL